MTVHQPWHRVRGLRAVAVAAVLAVLAGFTAPAAQAAGSAGPIGPIGPTGPRSGSQSADSQSTGPQSTGSSTPAGAFGPGAAASPDLAVNAFGDGLGYHIQVGTEKSGFTWHEVALLRPDGLDDSSWTGYQCTSGDGRYEAVAVLPMSAVNNTSALEHGAFAYSVDLQTGKVRPIATGVALRYFSPGCGTGDLAAFTVSLGDQEQTTEILTANLATGAVEHATTVSGELTSAVPTAGGLVAALGSNLVAVPETDGQATATKLAAAGGEPFDLLAAADGGVDFLSMAPGAQTATVRHERAGRVASLGTGPAATLALFQGRAGHNTVVGAGSLAKGSDLRQVAAGPLGAVRAASLDGDALLGGQQKSTDSDNRILATATGHIVTQVPATADAAVSEGYSSLVPAGVPAATGLATPAAPPSSPATPAKPKPAATHQANPAAPSSASAGSVKSKPAAPGQAAPAAPASVPAGLAKPKPAATRKVAPAAPTSAPAGFVKPKPAVSGPANPPAQAPVLEPSTAQTPACAVPRLAPTLQVMQPGSAQVDWAVQMAEQGLLTGSQYTRPADYDNMGLAAYAPSSDFPPHPLDHPSSDTWNSVPRSVFEAIMAQESNWDQASWHALPGISGDPIVADYYGAAGSINTINYAAADCGYGISQVTTGMFASQTGQEYSLHGQEKIATDYQENIAAGLQILEDTWNQLYTAGITVNGGDPKYLENWYYAIWAYNTGIEPNAAHGNTTGCTPGPTCTGPDGTWGLGWANNPANPAFPPNRLPYLKTTYADAAHPGDWPYQERVLGWMGSPLIRMGSTAYATPTYASGQTWLQLPTFDVFCTAAGDDCTPPTPGTVAPGTCNLADSDCWWHQPVTFVANCSSCATSSYTVGAGSSEPPVTDPHPPVCSLDTSAVPSTSNGPPVIVSAQVGLAAGATPLNDVGCGSSNWSNGGAFTMAYGTDANGDPIGAIDTHQLGAGLGGYIMFTHTEDGSDPDLINTGTWTPTLPGTEYYTVLAHIPATGATTGDADYVIDPGSAGLPTMAVKINQHLNEDVWIELGTFAMAPGGNVQLSNQSAMTPGGYDVGYDAMAFVPEGGTPGTPLGGDPTFPDDPTGDNPALPDCPCTVDSVGDPVDSATGYFGDSYTDLSVPGRGVALDFSRTYASGLADPNGPDGSLAANGPLGYGWTDSYNLSATTDPSTGNVTIHQEDGSQVTFTDSSGTYTPSAPRFLATLTKSGSTYTYARQGKEFFTFDVSTGHLLSEQTLPGKLASPPYATTLAYNSSGQLSTVTDPAGRTFTFGWTGGHITSLTDSAGREVTYGYDAYGDLTDVYGVGTTRTPSLQNNDHTVYTYNTTTHLLTSVRQPDFYGDTTTSPSPVMSMTYDTSERVLTQTDQLGRTTKFNYGPSSSPSLTAGQTLITKPSGSQTLDTYTSGLLTSQTTGYGSATPSTVKYTYDPVSLGVTSITDPDGDTETFSYDSQGNRISASNGLGLTTTYTYDALDDLTSGTDPLGVKTSYGYDEAGHIATATGTNNGTLEYGLKTSTTVQQMDQSAEIVDSNPGTLPSRTSEYYYDSAAHPADLTRSVDANGNTVKDAYDAEGELTAVTDAAGDETEYGYDTQTGQRTSEVTPDGVAAGTPVACTPPTVGCTTYSYDAFGNLAKTTDGNGHSTSATFDANGNKTSVTDADGRKTVYGYDAANEETSVTLPDGSTSEHLDYTPDGLTADYIDGTGAKTVYGYDAQDRKTSVTDPDGHKTTYGYDAAGNITTLTNPSSAVTTYTYDKADEPTKVSYSDGSTPATTLVYDSDGNRVSMTDGTGTSTWSYDAFGEIVSETDGAGATVGYGYDDNGNQTSIVYPAGAAQTVTQTFDKANRLKSVEDWNSATTSFGYDDSGNLASITYPDGDTVANAYDNVGESQSVTLSGAASASVSYTHDDADQVSSQTPTNLTGAAQTDGYTTDQQLGGVTSGGSTTPYAYNAAGEPTTAGGNTQAFDPAGQICWTLPNATSGNACGSAPTGATVYGFDPQGDLTSATPASGTATSYTYNQADQLTHYSGPGAAASYTYDGQGLRVGKTTGSTSTAYTWSIGQTPELLSDGTTDYLYGPGGLPIEQLAAAGPASTSLWYLHDAAGETRALLNGSGAIAGSYGYDAYGNPTHSGTATTPLQYGGGYTDPESGLIYLRARYYDPATEQFLTVDPLVATTQSPYDYVGGSPLDSADPDGTSWLGDLGDDLEDAAGDVESVAEDAAPVVLPIVADVVVDGVVEVATDGAGTAVLPELDAELDGAIDGSLEAGDEATTDAASDAGSQQQDYSNYEPTEEQLKPFRLDCDDDDDPYAEYGADYEDQSTFQKAKQGNNSAHNSHFDAIMDQYGITDPDDRERIHQEINQGLDDNGNASDDEIIDAIESLFGGGEE